MTDDTALLTAWGRGDRAAGAELVNRHYEAIVRFFRNKAADEADELVQRTFLACAEGASKFRGQGSVRAYLFGIARNLLYEHIRGRIRDGRADPDFRSASLADLGPGISTIAAKRADQRVLLAALQHIPVEMQVLLELYYWEDLGVDELAQVLEVPPGTVKSRLHRARELLRDATEKVGATPDDSRSAQALLEAWARRVSPGD